MRSFVLCFALSCWLGPLGFAPRAVEAGQGQDPILRWNDVAVQTVVEDHSGTDAREPGTGDRTHRHV